MSVSDKLIQQVKDLMQEKSDKEVTWEEAAECAGQLQRYASLVFDIWVRDQRNQDRLKEEPKGFPLDGAYTCVLCGYGARADNNWYDKWGVKCLVCQRAIERGEVPGWVVKHRDSWYSKFELEDRFKLTTPILKSWIKKGIIKPRIITRDGQGVHVQIFLLYDNRDFLPPKRLTKSELVCEEKDGKKWYRAEPWYRFVDPFEHLKGYRIMEYMRPSSENGA